MAVEHLHIKKVEVENYKSLKNSEAELKEGLNIIIGNNGVGKSNFLDFIFKYCIRFPWPLALSVNANFSVSFEYKRLRKRNVLSYSIKNLKPTGSKTANNPYEIIFNKRDGDKEIVRAKKVVVVNGIQEKKSAEIEKLLFNEYVVFNDFETSYISFGIPDQILWVSNPGRVIFEKDNLNNIPIEEFSSFGFLTELQIQVQAFLFDEVDEDTHINPNSLKEQIFNLLNSFIENSSVNAYLEQNTVIKKIRLNPNLNSFATGPKIIIENIFIDFFVNGEWIPWSYLSDGTKRIFYIISESLSVYNGLLLIEEPEIGIHPHQFYKLLQFLKEQSREKQIVISTHSPLALDILDEKELNRIIIAEYDNGTKFRRLTKAETAKAKRYMTEVGDLSTYWLHSDLEQ